MGQEKIISLVESIINVIFGYFIAVISQIIIFSFFDINISLMQNLEIGLYFTIISIIRSYFVRRLFNKYNQHIHSFFKRF